MHQDLYSLNPRCFLNKYFHPPPDILHMKKEGRTDLVEKIRAKKRHVDEHIEKYTDKAA